ncbi:hypothetical protein DL897_02330 [Thermoflavimicrobium daqui]|uniref:Uncharacterized protein n=2 Tax=Thermoflavimicrobium daqui TaxID=2137476 RepID=A0A364K9D7_9BACL|nr:hypothetical protein DL897_02330 [Thermoflavimicrobium daqui]
MIIPFIHLLESEIEASKMEKDYRRTYATPYMEETGSLSLDDIAISDEFLGFEPSSHETNKDMYSFTQNIDSWQALETASTVAESSQSFAVQREPQDRFSEMMRRLNVFIEEDIEVAMEVKFEVKKMLEWTVEQIKREKIDQRSVDQLVQKLISIRQLISPSSSLTRFINDFLEELTMLANRLPSF